jgi:hypothetical protein
MESQFSGAAMPDAPVTHGLTFDPNGVHHEKIRVPQNLPVQSDKFFHPSFDAGAQPPSGFHGSPVHYPHEPTLLYMQGTHNSRLVPQYEQELPLHAPNVTYTLPPPSPFTGKLVELKDPIEYWRFEEDLEARLNDGAWHPIIVQARFARHLLAYVPDLDEDIDVPLSRVRPLQAVFSNTTTIPTLEGTRTPRRRTNTPAPTLG